MLNSGQKFRTSRDKKINILTLVLSEIFFLNESKNHSPPQLNGRSLMKDEVQNTKCIYSLQIKPLTRQGNEDKIRYFYRKGGTSWSSCNYGIKNLPSKHLIFQLYIPPYRMTN